MNKHKQDALYTQRKRYLRKIHQYKHTLEILGVGYLYALRDLVSGQWMLSANQGKVIILTEEVGVKTPVSKEIDSDIF